MTKASGWHRKRRDTAAERARNAIYASPEHRAHQRQVRQLVEAGRASCWRCGRFLPPGSPVHAGHDDVDRSVYRGPECPSCNVRTAARRAAVVRNARQPGRATRVRL